MPIINELVNNDIGHNINIFLGDSKKYNSPLLKDNLDFIKKSVSDLSVFYRGSINIENIERLGLPEFAGNTYFIEGVGIEYSSRLNNNIVLTYMTDFVSLFDKYVDLADFVVFPNKSFANHYNKDSCKNVYIGSPKYCVDFNKQTILDKYGLNSDRNNALILLPKLRYFDGKINNVYGKLRDAGYNVITKTRGKDSISGDKSLFSDYYFEDYSWFPHTSMELMYVSDFVVNFDSTSIKESIMLSKPMVNFKVKKGRMLPFLYDNNIFCFDYDYNIDNINNGIDKFLDYYNNNISFIDSEFYLMRENYLFNVENSNVCERLIQL
jgi:hypothetical protein